MFFDDVSKVQEIARKCGTAVFVVPDDVMVKIDRAYLLQPEDKTVITIEQVRQMLPRLELKQKEDVFVIIRPADKMQRLQPVPSFHYLVGRTALWHVADGLP